MCGNLVLNLFWKWYTFLWGNNTFFGENSTLFGNMFFLLLKMRPWTKILDRGIAPARKNADPDSTQDQIFKMIIFPRMFFTYPC